MATRVVGHAGTIRMAARLREIVVVRVDICLYRHMISDMARARTTADAFNAIAEPHRREILTLLKGRERVVSDIADAMGMNQPAVSKHLRVLLEVGLVYVHPDGKQRRYGLDARGLEPVHGWTGGFEEYWSESLERLNAYVKKRQGEEER